MKKEEVEAIEYMLLIENEQEENPQGVFQSLYRSTDLEEIHPIQVSLAVLTRNAIKGMHRINCQRLITCLTGSLLVTVVDLRVDSETYGNKFQAWLDDPKKSILIPEYCAVGLFSNTETTVLEIADDTSDSAKVERFDWQSFGIKWPKRKNYILSAEDRSAPKWQGQL
jgi:dTDP-4-dehydrorhamnose 3,5-epimerase-like enzyme